MIYIYIRVTKKHTTMVSYDIHIITMISLVSFIWKVCSDSVSQVYYTKVNDNDGLTLYGDILSLNSVQNLNECSYFCETHLECTAFYFSNGDIDNCQLKTVSTLDKSCSGPPSLDSNHYIQEVRALEC